MCIALVFFIMVGSFGCHRMARPALWTSSRAIGCNLERIWSHTLDGLADLTEAELMACEAACQRQDGEACVGAGLMLHYGATSRMNKQEARRLFRQQCKANVFPGCVSLWVTDMDADMLKGRRFGGMRGLADLENYCEKGERHACEAVGNHFKQRLQTLHFDWDVEMAVRYQNAACKRGSLSGCTGVGWLYLAGDGVPMDQRKAAGILQQECQRGHIPACSTLGMMYDKGLGVSKDAAKSLELYRSSCDGGAPKACYEFGNKFWPRDEDEDEEGANPEIALEYFQKACLGGFALGCKAVGIAYFDGTGVAADHKRAIQYYEAACHRGAGDACHELGYIFEWGDKVAQDSSQAIRFYEAGCDYGNPPSCNEMAHYYLEGDGVEKNADTARSHFSKACIGGEADACYQLGLMQARGTGGYKDESLAVRNLEKACKWQRFEACVALDFYHRYRAFRPESFGETERLLLEACHKGNMHGCYDLAELYRQEETWELDPQIFVLVQKACDGGVNEACVDVGTAYVDGQGVDPDVPKGVRLLEDACRHRNGRACYSLGIRYRDGFGVPEDQFKAVLLFDDACVKLPEVCADATALRARYRAEHEPAKTAGERAPAPKR